MPTAQDAKDHKALLDEAGLRGYSLSLKLDKPMPQWYYRADGTRMPNKLPADPHHRRQYAQKGLTLIPPENPVELSIDPRYAKTAQSEAPKAVNGVADGVAVGGITVNADGGFQILPGTPEADIRHFMVIWKATSMVSAPMPEAPTLTVEEPVTEATSPSYHIHNYSKKMGSKCRYDGCSSQRTKEFVARGPRTKKGPSTNFMTG